MSQNQEGTHENHSRSNSKNGVSNSLPPSSSVSKLAFGRLSGLVILCLLVILFILMFVPKNVASWYSAGVLVCAVVLAGGTWWIRPDNGFRPKSWWCKIVAAVGALGVLLGAFVLSGFMSRLTEPGNVLFWFAAGVILGLVSFAASVAISRWDKKIPVDFQWANARSILLTLAVLGSVVALQAPRNDSVKYPLDPAFLVIGSLLIGLALIVGSLPLSRWSLLGRSIPVLLGVVGIIYAVVEAMRIPGADRIASPDVVMFASWQVGIALMILVARFCYPGLSKVIN